IKHRDHEIPVLTAGSGSLTSLICLGGELRDHLPHGSDVSWSSLFDPGLISIRSLFQVGQEQRIGPPLPSFLNWGPYSLPDEEELAVGFEEQVFMKQSVVQVSACLVPVADHHHEECPALGSHRRDSHGVVERLGEKVLGEPIA